MASLRSTVRIDRPADAVWAVVADAGGIAAWFPGFSDAHLDGDVRIITLGSGDELGERVVTNDAALRRFQYTVTSAPVLPESHLGTVDVLDIDGAALVVWSADVEPESLAELIGSSLEAGVAALKTYCEQR